MTTPNANDVLMGGGGSPALKFTTPGDNAKGRIIAPPEVFQTRKYDKDNPGAGDLQFYPSGDPIMGIAVDLATDLRDPSIEDDDGTRRFYIDGRYIKGDVRDAVRAAGAPGLEVGGVLDITFTHREDPEDKRSRKFWRVIYTPAGNAALMTPDAAVGGQPAPAAAPVSTPAAQPVSAPAPTPAPAAPAAAADTPAVKAKSLAALGLTPEQIAPQLGLDPQVVAMLIAA